MPKTTLNGVLFGGIVVLVMLSFPKTVYAAAWLMEQGATQRIHTVRYFENRYSAYIPGTTATFIQKDQAVNYQTYAEKGILPFLTVGGVTYAGYFIKRPDEDEVTRFDPYFYSHYSVFMDIFARFPLWQRTTDTSTVISLQPLARGQYYASAPDSLGLSTEGRILLGHSFMLKGHSSFINTEAAYQFTFDTKRKDYHLDLTAGYHFSEKWLLMPQFFGIFTQTSPIEGRFRTLDHDTWTKAECNLSLVWHFTEAYSIQVGGYKNFSKFKEREYVGLLLSFWHEF